MIELPLHLIELDKNNFHLILESKISNESVYWIIDTGASKSVFDINLDHLYRLIEPDKNDEYLSAGINVSPIETKIGSVSFQLGETVAIENLTVALIDMKHVTKIYKKYTDLKIGGLLGGDILNRYGCCIDYLNETIAFNKE